MGILPEGNFECLKKLLKPAKKVNDKDLQTLKAEDLEERIQLWNEIKENLTKYEDGECGEFDRGIHSHTIAEFKMAQLKLAATFFTNREEVAGTEKLFTPKEIDLVIKLEKYNSFDIKTKEDVIGEIRRGNKTTIGYIKDYMVEMKGDVDKVLNDPEIKLPVRLAIKQIMKKRLEVLQAGVSELIMIEPTALVKEAEAHLGSRVSEIKREVEEEGRKIVEEKLRETEAKTIELEGKKAELELEKAELRAKRDEISERLKQLAKTSEDKSIRVVTKEDARLYELNFIARFDTKMQTFPLKIYSPIENKTFEINSWHENSHIKHSEREAADTSMPQNVSSRYVIEEKKHRLFGEKVKRVIIEAVSFNHLNEYENYGFDARRAGLAEFLERINRFIDSAELGKYLHVIGIASPTGWEEKVVREIQSSDFAHNYVSRYVSVCLVDSVTGEVVYNPADDRIAKFKEFFEPQFDRERVEKVKKFILEKFKTKDYVVFEDVLEETKEDRAIVNKAFYDLEKEGKGRARYIKDVGLVLEVGR